MRHPLLATLVFALLAAAVAPTDARAQIRVGPRVTVDVADDIDSGYAIGADLRLKPLVLPIQLNAAAEYYLDVDAGNVYAFDANAVYVFGLATNAVFAPYAGGGIGLVTVSPDDGESDSDVGLNVVGGAQMLNVFPLVTPFVQAQASFGTEVNGADVNRVSLTGGLLFTL